MQAGSQSLIAIPHDWFRQMRATSPVYFNRRAPFSWSIFRYAEALYVLNHPDIFSSAPLPGSMQPALPSILGMDEPRHRKLRALVSRVFTPQMVNGLTPRISEIVNDVLDIACERGELDVVQDLAYPLPLTIIAELIGVPSEEYALFRRWSSALVSATTEEAGPFSSEERIQALRSLRGYFARQLDAHRRRPHQDLISSLLAAEIDGEKLSDEELIDFCQLLLIAGHETTANLIGNAMVCFEEHPDAVAQLRKDPSLMPRAVEEILRCYPSVPGISRVALQPATLGGQQVEAGQTVHIFIASANYDEAQFPDPQRFDVRRDPNRHLSFGHGIHYCLGAPLARLEASTALILLLWRLKDIQRIPGRPVGAVNTFLTYGVRHFWIGCKPS
jgi:cytochrome P450